MPAEMEVPCRIIDAIANLHEAVEILRTKIELRVRPSKVKAPIFSQFALGVLTMMALTLGRRGNGLKPDGWRTHSQPPGQLRIIFMRRQRDSRPTPSACESFQGAIRFTADDRRSGHKFQRRRRHMIGMHR